MLAIAMHEKPGAAIIDVSQNPGRTRTVEREAGQPLCSRAILPNSSLFMVDESLPARPLLGRECLTLSGFPWQKSPELLRRKKGHGEEFSDSLLMDLSGNAFGGSVVLAVVLSCLMSIAWVDSQEKSKSRIVGSVSAPNGKSAESGEMDEVLAFLGIEPEI